MKHLLSAADLTHDDAEMILETAAAMHDVQNREVKKLPALRGRTVVNLFFEDSTRTRSSFEIAGKWLSADVINVSAKGSSVSKGESLRDTVMTVAAMGVDGLVILTTLGTGIGSAFLHDGVLVPNSELGHLEIDGAVAESRAAASVREAEGLSWSEWAARLQRYYAHVERLFTPDLFVVGGGVSKHADKYLPLLDLRTPIVPAARRNRAGIIGAATVAAGD